MVGPGLPVLDQLVKSLLVVVVVVVEVILHMIHHYFALSICPICLRSYFFAFVCLRCVRV